MDGNFLQSLNLPPELLQQLAEQSTVEMQGVPVPPQMTEFAPQMQPGPPIPMNGMGDMAPPPVNVLQGAEMPQPAMVPQALQPATAPRRERHSLLDKIGRISDVLARVGGAEALYQPTLDQREDRSIARGNQARLVDMDALRRTQAEQTIATGTDEAEGRDRAVLGRAILGLQSIKARGGDISQAWPILARQMGISDEKVQEIGQIFAADPNALEGLAAALNDPKQQGTSSTAIQNYNAYQQILATQGKAAADQFLSMAQPASEIQPYQEAQLNESAADRAVRIQEGRENRAFKEQQAAENRAFREEEARRRRTGEGSNLTPTQRGAVVQTKEFIPGVRTQLLRVEQLSQALNDNPASGAIGGRVPGQLVGGSAAQFDRAQSLLASQIRTLIRTVGEGSMSDYESRLNVATLPARTDSDSGRKEAIDNLKILLTEIEARSSRLLSPPSSAPANPAPRQNSRPRTMVGAPRPPAVGTVRQGYRFKGGNPGSPASWEKVR